MLLVASSNGAIRVVLTSVRGQSDGRGGAALKLPDGWPSNVPVYPGAAIRSVMKTTGAKSVTLATNDTSAKVADYYKTKSGLSVENDMDLGEQRILSLKNGKGGVTVTIGAAGAETMVKLMIVD